MTAKNGSISLVLKLVLVAAVVGAGIFFGLRWFSDTAEVRPVKRDTAVNAVPGSIEVAAEKGGVRPIKTELGGKVAWCDALTPGAAFKKGDVLMKLDTSDLLREIKDAERNYTYAQEERAAMIKASTAKAQAEEALVNAKRLFERGEISNEMLKAAQRTLADIESKIEIEAAKNKKAGEDYEFGMESKKIQLKRMEVIAPEDGVVKEVLVWEGALISPGSPVATFLSNKRLVAAKISEENFGGIKLGQAAKVKLLIYPGEAPFNAKVSGIQGYADEGTQRYTVFLDVDVDPARLPHNSTGQVTITVATRSNALLFPRRALFNSNNVYVVKNGRVELREVTLGFLDLNRAEALKGLEEGELVIVENTDTFHRGQRVRVAGAK
ncbi:MAG: efflux RND transporter periplasmic adaptor subunit [Verrucomicrobia bacterium]|nr:efflux RND transporter periplasmic adaptor subunit [Verrucomicrobiota bacterium]